MIVKPKGSTLLHMYNWSFMIELAPQQKWVCDITYNNAYKLTRKNLTITLNKEDFDKYFRIIER